VKTIGCCLLVLLIGWLKGEALHAADKTRIAVTNFNLSYLAVGVAIKRGFFKDERLDVEVIRMNTPNTVTAMITGDVGYTMLFGSVIRAALRGMPLRAMASLLDRPTHAGCAGLNPPRHRCR
jgi:ABC-type nitrate/sulfonate/bicarbonate transport system substrate-binding protein